MLEHSDNNWRGEHLLHHDTNPRLAPEDRKRVRKSKVEKSVMTKEPTFTIAEMADAFGVTLRTLRFYEQKELLFPRRTDNTRVYDNAQRERMRTIQRGIAAGLSLEQIRQAITPDGTCIKLPKGWIEELRLNMQTAHQKAQSLEATIGMISAEGVL